MRFFYRIKVPMVENEKFQNYWSYGVIEQGYVEAENKKKARLKLEKEMNRKLPMRSKLEDIGVKNFFLLSLYEANEFFDKIWLSKRECKECGSNFTKLERDQANDFRRIKEDFCSFQCEDKNKITEKDLEIKEGIHNACIYKITNKLTGMSYVGQTTQAFTLRWYQHFFQTKDTKFHKAILNSKLKDWKFEIIEQFNFKGSDVYKDKKLKNLVDEREQFFINFFDSIENGYNSAIAKKEDQDSL